MFSPSGVMAPLGIFGVGCLIKLALLFKLEGEGGGCFIKLGLFIKLEEMYSGDCQW